MDIHRRNSIIIIPAYEPDEKLVDYVSELQENGFERIIVVDDGSGIRYREVFARLRNMGIVVLKNMRNLGKGQAIKAAFLFIRNRYGRTSPMITVDADGQHLVKDVVRMDEEIHRRPAKLILGTRDFSGSDVPKKSRYGNRITSKMFRLSTGVDCPDTQTGLRGIPASLLDFSIGVEGSRYEYEMNFLTDAVERGIGLVYLPIETIYKDGNRCSHFRPLRDSLRIYGRLVRFVVSSLTSAGVDLLLFYLFLAVLHYPRAEEIVFATVGARLCSGFVNFELNKHFSFKSRGSTVKEGVKYFLLFVGQMMLSAGGVAVVSIVLSNMAAKVLVDAALFVISYIVQRRWVFAKERSFGKGVGYEQKKKVAAVDANL